MKATCGECTLCCKLLSVKEVQTPPGEWCQHCAPGQGCRIYPGRPKECREFECGWLTNNGHPKLRPDKVHMILTGQEDLLDCYFVHVDPAYPDAPRRPLGKVLLETVFKHGERRNIVLITGNRRVVIGPNARAIEAELTKLDRPLTDMDEKDPDLTGR